MAEPLDKLAKRLEADPFFLACPLRLFAQSEKLADRQLAEKLGCSVETLVHIRLCRAPAGEAARFQKDIDRIATEFGIDSAPLIEAVRLGQAILSLRERAGSDALMAARDADKKKPKPKGDGA